MWKPEYLRHVAGVYNNPMNSISIKW